MNVSNIELRMRAKQKYGPQSGKFVVTTLIYGGISLGLSLIASIVILLNMTITEPLNTLDSIMNFVTFLETDFYFQTAFYIGMIIVQAIMSVFLAGIQYMCLQNARGKQIKISDIFYVVKNNPDKVIIISLISSIIALVLSLPSTALTFFADINGGSELFASLGSMLDLAATLASYIVLVMMSQCVYIFLDDKDESVVNIIKKSISLMKGNIWPYIFMELLFRVIIGFTTIFTLGVALLWVFPYREMVFAFFYLKVNGELATQTHNVYTDESVMPNQNVYTDETINPTQNVYTEEVVNSDYDVNTDNTVETENNDESDAL